MTDKLSEYGYSFQVKVLAAFFTDRSFLQQISDIIKPEYFESDANNWILEVILAHFAQFKSPPTHDVLKVALTKLDDDVLKLAIIEQLKEVFKYFDSSDLSFVKEKILEFCKNQELKNALIESVGRLKTGDYEGIRVLVDSAMKAGVDTDVGLDYKTQIEIRYAQSARATVETGWDVIDDLTDGGLGKGELGVVMAPAGIGKSWLLVNIGASALKAGKNVIHYTLELNQDYVGQRYDSVITGINAQDLKNHPQKIEKALENVTGELTIKYYPTKSAGINTIKAHIDKMIMLGKKPDLIILDYADLLKTGAGKFEKHEALETLYEELRGVGGEYDCPVWTATQANRSSLEEDIIEADKVASSYGKIMVSDFIMSLSRKVGDKLSGTGRVHVIKNRFGPDGITLPSNINTNNGRFDLFEPDSNEGRKTTKSIKNQDVLVKKNLAEKLKSFG